MAAQFLIRAADVIPAENAAQKLLKIYYLSQASTNINTDSLKPIAFRPKCEKCLAPWNKNDFHMTIKRPKKISKNAKRIVNAYETNPDKLSKAKTMMAKKWKNKLHNKVATICHLCNNAKRTVLQTRKYPKEKESSTIGHTKKSVKERETSKAKQIKNLEVPEDDVKGSIQSLLDNNTIKLPTSLPPLMDIKTLELIRPKKRKKDKFAGLNIRPKDEKESKPNYVIQKIAVETKKLKLSSDTKVKQNSKIAQNQKQSKNMIQKTKDFSATKQRNNMLLLANVLKMNETKKEKNINSGLQKLLK